MKEIWRSILYLGKNLFRDIGFTFWGLIYPMILAGFFYTAFSGFTDYEMDIINIGIQEGNPISSILEEIEILNVVEISDSDIEDKLDSGEIAGYIKDDMSLIVDRSELDQSIIKGILDQIKQTIALDAPFEDFDFGVDYLETKSQEANAILIIFYALIAMVSTYGVFPGIEAGIISQANLTHIGARINLTPINKSTIIISGVVVGLTINILSNLLLLLFMKFILKLDLFTNIAYSIVFILLGNLFGIALGVFIGVSNKMRAGAKTMISIVFTLFLSFLGGLMSPNVKIMIEKNVPILAKINPIAIITNNLYRINLLDNTKDLSADILILLAYSLILMVGSYHFLRRRQYDSI